MPGSTPAVRSRVSLAAGPGKFRMAVRVMVPFTGTRSVPGSSGRPARFYLEIVTMRDFACPNCGQRLAFENSMCLGCNNPIGFDLSQREFAILGADGVTTAGPKPIGLLQPRHIEFS